MNYFYASGKGPDANIDLQNIVGSYVLRFTFHASSFTIYDLRFTH